MCAVLQSPGRGRTPTGQGVVFFGIALRFGEKNPDEGGFGPRLGIRCRGGRPVAMLDTGGFGEL